jgi:FkbM family methyltransferase
VELELVSGHRVEIADESLELGHALWNKSTQALVAFLYDILSRLDNPVLVDGGASVGLFSLLAAAVPGMISIAFEPTDLAHIATRNVEMNDLQDRVHVYNIALFDRAGEMTIHRPRNRKQRATLAERPGFHNAESFVVPIVRLDDVMDGYGRVDVIKLDVEGAELAVLRGAKKLIKVHKPAIVAEVQNKRTRPFGYRSWDIVQFLRDRNYQFHKVTERDVYFWQQEVHHP